PTCAPQLGKRRAKRSRKVPDGPPQKRSPASAATNSKSHSRCGGRRSRNKGSRGERQLINLLQDAGIAAQRIPLSGSAGGKFAGDVSIPLLGNDRIAEVKARASGFRQLYAWLDGRDLLALKADRADWLVVLPFQTFIQMVAAAELAKRHPGFAETRDPLCARWCRTHDAINSHRFPKESKMKALAIKETENLPATPAPENPYLKIAAEGGDNPGQLLKFVKGKWMIGDEQVAIGTEYVCYLNQAMRGWTKFEDN